MKHAPGAGPGAATLEGTMATDYTTQVTTTVDSDKLDGLRKLSHILYALYAIHWLTGGITALIAIVVNYVKRDDARGTLYASHFAWQIRTFWWAILWYAVGGGLFLTVLLIPMAIGLWCLLSLWMLYRIIKGWLYLNDRKPMYPGEQF
ncbi:putative membrane protein [Cupriavidus agavae]|uniref:Putative membrane protein n=2 Tax=Cupriavidus agavae TaxID=1001822 RepID=A0A4Q7RGM2_9BURK|nr:putative membrane protein [Cupriavidus agavae]